MKVSDMETKTFIGIVVFIKKYMRSVLLLTKMNLIVVDNAEVITRDLYFCRLSLNTIS